MSSSDSGETLGYVGTTGNAQGKPAHLHYAIFSPISRLQSFRPVVQGWKRVFYRDPGGLIGNSEPEKAALWNCAIKRKMHSL